MTINEIKTIFRTVKHNYKNASPVNYPVPLSDYEAGKEGAGWAACEFLWSFSKGDVYSWGELAEIGAYFEKLARRYGLVEDFRENGII